MVRITIETMDQAKVTSEAGRDDGMTAAAPSAPSAPSAAAEPGSASIPAELAARAAATGAISGGPAPTGPSGQVGAPGFVPTEVGSPQTTTDGPDAQMGQPAGAAPDMLRGIETVAQSEEEDEEDE